MVNNSLLFCTGVPLICGFASAWETRKAVKSKWYQSVKKPSFNPPRYVFAPIWTYLYISTGYALYLVQNDVQKLTDAQSMAHTFASWGIYAFWTQLLANILWSNLYFVKREINLALVDILVLWGLSLATTICFYNVNPIAGGLMVPYLIWASYATVLTYSVKKLNPDFKNPSKSQ